MLRVLNPRIHGALDYLLAIAFLIAPGVFEFAFPAGPLAYIIGLVYLGASIFTKYPLGVLKLIPFPLHGLIESVMAASWIVMPWLFGFAADPAARNFFVLAGAGLLLVAALTNYQASGAAAYRGEDRRHALVDRRQRALAIYRAGQDRRGGRKDRRSYALAR